VGPTSIFVLILLCLAGAAAIATTVRLGNHIARSGAAAGVLVLGLLIGLVAVNDNYGYYRSWSAVFTGVFGSAADVSFEPKAERVAGTELRSGSLTQIDLPGALSHIDRRGLIYLPPQYADPKYADVRFPVVELFHGSPGQPSDWELTLNIAHLTDLLISKHAVGPMVLVMPASNTSSRYLEGVDGPHGADETYLAQDVPADVRARYRVSSAPAQWGLAGYSSGGYVTANLGLRHRGWFGALGILDGYFRAADGPAAAALGNSKQLEQQNSPIDIARSLPADTSPMPPVWIGAGTGDPADYVSARAFAQALDGLDQSTFVSLQNGGHDFYAFSAAMPDLLNWLWEQLASPEQRDAFPITGSPNLVRLTPQFRHNGQPIGTAAAATSGGTASGVATSGRATSGGAAPAARPSTAATVTVTVTASPVPTKSR
jgi:enterochelin esterase-like enzyme